MATAAPKKGVWALMTAGAYCVDGGHNSHPSQQPPSPSEHVSLHGQLVSNKIFFFVSFEQMRVKTKCLFRSFMFYCVYKEQGTDITLNTAQSIIISHLNLSCADPRRSRRARPAAVQGSVSKCDQRGRANG